MHVDITGRLHQHQSDAAVSRQRTARSRLHHRAHGRSGRRRTGHRSGRVAAAQLRPASAMPFKTGLTFTYDCGEFEKNMDLALELADVKGFKARKADAGNAASCRPRHFPTRSSAPARRARKAPKCVSTAPARSIVVLRLEHARPGPRNSLQADRLRPARPRSERGRNTSRATPIRCFYGEGTGGSRSATMAGSAFHLATERSSTKGARDRRAYAQGRAKPI